MTLARHARLNSLLKVAVGWLAGATRSNARAALLGIAVPGGWRAWLSPPRGPRRRRGGPQGAASYRTAPVYSRAVAVAAGERAVVSTRVRGVRGCHFWESPPARPPIRRRGDAGGGGAGSPHQRGQAWPPCLSREWHAGTPVLPRTVQSTGALETVSAHTPRHVYGRTERIPGGTRETMTAWKLGLWGGYHIQHELWIMGGIMGAAVT